mmetsp:Transcript_30561/g.55679  ORF Transcript_30561/g.55679 Transcript_30561/m.55679 type:complete len:265 (+) Transcript_30561:50-844(+)
MHALIPLVDHFIKSRFIRSGYWMYLAHALSSKSHKISDGKLVIFYSISSAILHTFVLNVFNHTYLKWLNGKVNLQWACVTLAYIIYLGIVVMLPVELQNWFLSYDGALFLAMNPLVSFLYYTKGFDRNFLTKQGLLGVLACSTHLGIQAWRDLWQQVLCWLVFCNLQDLDERNTREDRLADPPRKTLPILLLDRGFRRTDIQMVFVFSWIVWVVVERAGCMSRFDGIWLLLMTFVQAFTSPGKQGYAVFILWLTHWCWGWSAQV